MKISNCLILCFFASLVLCFSANADPRMWGNEGIPIRQGEHVKWNSTMARDTSGNTLVVWSDKRDGDRDIRAQLYNPAGAEQWVSAGVDVTPHPSHQDAPVAVAVYGGWIVAWVDYRHCPNDFGCSDIYAQKLDYQGNRLWAQNDFTGVAVDVAERWIDKYSLQIEPDGAGGAILVWLDDRAGLNVYGQRVQTNGTVAWVQAIAVTNTDYLQEWPKTAPGADGTVQILWSYYQAGRYRTNLSSLLADGTLPWGQAGMPACTTAWNGGAAAQIIPDGENGCYAAWKDNRNGTFADIYAQHFGSDGQPQWAVNGIPVCTAPYDQNGVDLTESFANGSRDGIIAAWQDNRFAGYGAEIYGQKILPDGAIAWANNGVLVSDPYSENTDRWSPRVVTDHNGGAVFAWNFQNFDDWAHWPLRAARVNASGSPVWSSQPLPVGRDGAYQYGTVLAGDFGTYSVAWHELDTTGRECIRYQLLDHGSGARLLGDAGVAPMSGIGGNAYNVRGQPMNNHRTAFVWEDNRPELYGTMLYYQIAGWQGNVERTVNGEPLAPNNTVGTVYSQKDPHACDDGSGGLFVCFTDNRWGTKLIRLAQIDAAGDVVSPDSGVLIWSPPLIRDQQYSRVVPDGQGGCYVAWTGYAQNFWLDVYVMRMDATLQPLWNQPVRLNESYFDDNLAALVPGSDGCCMAVWQSGDYYNYNVSMAKVCPDGSVAWNDTLCNAPGDQGGYNLGIVAVSDGSGGMYVAWDDRRAGLDDPDIYAQRVAADGASLWAANGVGILIGAGYQTIPEIAVDSRGDLNVVWRDFRNGIWSQVFAQKLSPNGELRWAQSGVPVNIGAETSSLSLVASEGRDGVLPVWTDNRAYYSHAFATHLDSTGSLYNDPFWQPDSGGPVAEPTAEKWQTDITAVTDGWGGFVAGWPQLSEEYDDGGDRQYTLDVYAQRIFDYASAAEAPENLIPRDYALYQNYPNPFNPATEIRFELPQAGRVKLAVFDLLGRDVSVLVDGTMRAGQQRVTFDASALPSGVYVYQLEAGNFRQAKKLVLLR